GLRLPRVQIDADRDRNHGDEQTEGTRHKLLQRNSIPCRGGRQVTGVQGRGFPFGNGRIGPTQMAHSPKVCASTSVLSEMSPSTRQSDRRIMAELRFTVQTQKVFPASCTAFNNLRVASD